MRAVKLDAGSEDLANPGSSSWDGVDAEEVALAPTPDSFQTNEYVRAAWANREHGLVKSVSVKAAHNGNDVALRLEWEDTEHPEAEFPDACAVVFPSNGSADLATLGSSESSVDLWYWRSDRGDVGEEVVAKGVSDLSTLEGSAVNAKASFSGGKWAVVLSRPASAGGTEISPGAAKQVAFLVWEGKNEERAGLAAISQAWQELEIDG